MKDSHSVTCDKGRRRGDEESDYDSFTTIFATTTTTTTTTTTATATTELQ